MDGCERVLWTRLPISVEVASGKKMGALIEYETGRRVAWSFGNGCDVELQAVAGEPWLVVIGTGLGRPLAGWKLAWDETIIEFYKIVDGDLAPFTDEDWETLRKGRKA